MDVALFGCGYAGRKWASVIESHPAVDTLYCVDTDPTKSDIVSDITANFFLIDVFNNNEFSPSKQAQYRALVDCDVWVVAVGYQKHTDFIQLADSCNIEKVLVEKPLTANPNTNTLDFDCEAYVNYVETIHPVFEAITKTARTDNATITRAFHWRGKDSRDSVGINTKHEFEHPAVKDDLVHDISELYIGFQLLQQDSNFELTTIDKDERWEDVEYKSVYPYQHLTDDAWVQLTFQTDDGDYVIQGGFTDEATRRFFIWIDDTAETAYYGNTLTRDYTSPAAYKISGTDNIDYVLNKLKSGEIVTKDDETTLFGEINATELEVNNSQHTFKRMFDKVISGNPVPTVFDALQIEQIAEQFYERTDAEYGSYF